MLKHESKCLCTVEERCHLRLFAVDELIDKFAEVAREYRIQRLALSAQKQE